MTDKQSKLLLNTLNDTTDTDGEYNVEPVEYFEHLKSSLTDQQKTNLHNQLHLLNTQIKQAKSLDQDNLVNILLFYYRSIQKELILCELGFTKFVYRDALNQYVDQVTPKNSIKVIELKRYQRFIPSENAEIIQSVKDKELFDEIIVVFTDLTSNKYQTPAEREFVDKNKDPVALGVFYNEEQDIKHERLYVITDWVDQYCDLNLTKMLDEMSSVVSSTHIHGEIKSYEDIVDMYVSQHDDFDYSITGIGSWMWTKFKNMFNWMKI